MLSPLLFLFPYLFTFRWLIFSSFYFAFAGLFLNILLVVMLSLSIFAVFDGNKLLRMFLLSSMSPFLSTLLFSSVKFGIIFSDKIIFKVIVIILISKSLSKGFHKIKLN